MVQSFGRREPEPEPAPPKPEEPAWALPPAALLLCPQLDPEALQQVYEQMFETVQAAYTNALRAALAGVSDIFAEALGVQVAEPAPVDGQSDSSGA